MSSGGFEIELSLRGAQLVIRSGDESADVTVSRVGWSGPGNTAVPWRRVAMPPVLPTTWGGQNATGAI